MARGPGSQKIYQQLMERIQAGKLKPVTFLCGPEQFFTDRIQEAVLEKVPPEARDFNLDLVYGQDADISRILDMARSYPMMSDKRYVIVREFYNSIRDQTGKENSSLLEQMIPYFEKPSDHTVLIIHDTKKPPKNSRFYKAMDASDKVGFYEFDLIDGPEVTSWILDWTRIQHKRKMQPEAAEVLYQITGGSLHQLSTELEKICTFNKTDEPVSVKDVKSVTGFSRQYTVIELKDAVVSRNLQQAVHIAEQILRASSSDTGEIIRTVAFMYTVFANIWQYQRMEKKGLTPQQMAGQLGGPFRVKMISRDARNFRPAELPAVFEALLDTDKAIKGYSKLDVEAIFIMMLRRIIT